MQVSTTVTLMTPRRVWTTPILHRTRSRADGTVPPVDTIKAENVDPLFSDEYILGFEHAFDNDWIMGVRYVQRELSTQIDDIGINPAIVSPGR